MIGLLLMGRRTFWAGFVGFFLAGLLVLTLGNAGPGLSSTGDAQPLTSTPLEIGSKPDTESAAPRSGAASHDPRRILDHLANDTIDPSQIYVLRDTAINRDRLKVYFNRGFMAFLKPVEGSVTGGVFVGDGEVLLIPPNRVEKYSLALFTQTPILEERFDWAYLRFTDSTAHELLASARKPEADDPDQPTGLQQQWDPLLVRLNALTSMRVLQDLTGRRDLPFFSGEIHGTNLGLFNVSDDERLPEAVSVSALQTVQGTTFADGWCSFPSRTSAPRQDALLDGSARVTAYKLDTRIHDDNTLEADAELEMESLNSADRMLFFELSHRLTVTKAAELVDKQEKPLILFQYPSAREKPEITAPEVAPAPPRTPVPPPAGPPGASSTPDDTSVDDAFDDNPPGTKPAADSKAKAALLSGSSPGTPLESATANSSAGPEANLERENDWIAVVLPAAHPAGARFRLHFTYHGRVISNVGNGVLYVGEHGNWYPNRASEKLATYDITFHYPARLTLVATGRRLNLEEANGERTSRWVSEATLPVAGFNLGAYDLSSQRAGMGGKINLEVYATREAEAALESLNERMQIMPGVSSTARGAEGRSIVGYHEGMISRPVAPLDPTALLSKVLETTAGSVEYFETLFGPFPYPRLAISQIPGNFGQGWPELIYLPTLSFLSKSARASLGVETSRQDLADRTFIPHEIAHQWWGNELGWKTYRDQWLSEGFATYAGTLQLAHEKDGERHFRDILRAYKHDLLIKTRSGGTVASGGPIWLGRRLSNSENPHGYDEIVYKKACWVLHMLRQVLDSGPSRPSGETAAGNAQPNEPFFRMLREFVATYRGRCPSTEDFARVATRYLPASADLDHNRRLDWFFDDWVYGAGVPTYKLESKVRRDTAGRFVIQGQIKQSDVPEDFEMLVPVVAMYGRDRKVRLGEVPVSSTAGSFRFTSSSEPSRVAIDEENVLAVVR